MASFVFDRQRLRRFLAKYRRIAVSSLYSTDQLRLHHVAHGTYGRILKRITNNIILPVPVSWLIIQVHYFRIVVFPTRCFYLQTPHKLSGCFRCPLACGRCGRFEILSLSTSGCFLGVASTFPRCVIICRQWWRQMLHDVMCMFPSKQLQALAKKKKVPYDRTQIMFTRHNLA